jgi:hypothetical protein
VLEWQYPLKVLIVESPDHYSPVNLMTIFRNKNLLL